MRFALANPRSRALAQRSARHWLQGVPMHWMLDWGTPFPLFVAAAKGVYKHFMLKEILEQPECVLNTFRGRVMFDPPRVDLTDIDISDDVLRSVQRVVLIAMGTSLHAAMVGEYIMEALSQLDPVAYVRFASVYRNFREAKDFEDFVGRLGGERD